MISVFRFGHFKTLCFHSFLIHSFTDGHLGLRYIYTMEYYAAEKKKELLLFATAWMELESVMLSEISQTVRDKYHMLSPLTGT